MEQVQSAGGESREGDDRARFGTSSSLSSRSEKRERELPRTLRIQRRVGRLLLLPVGIPIVLLLKYRMRYRISRHREMRERFRALEREGGPLIVCANHLTLIDSVILLWGIAPLWSYLRDYRRFCWNLPAVENTRTRWSWRVLTYLNKCILVDRSGGSEHTARLLDRLRQLLRCGDRVMLFPEGTRSRNGRIDSAAATYGIGKLLQQVPECRVVCVYLRGQNQASYSDFPRRGEVFDWDLALIRPTTTASGLRGARDLARQVIHRLEQMEEDYFRFGSF